MNVGEAIELLQTLPPHWEFVVERSPLDHTRNPKTGGRDYHITADIKVDNFPTQGGMAVVILEGPL